MVWLTHHTLTGMNGAMIIKGVGASKYKRMDVDATSWPPRFWKLTMELEGGMHVAFTDARRFGKIQSVADPLATPPVDKMGPEYAYGYVAWIMVAGCVVPHGLVHMPGTVTLHASLSLPFACAPHAPHSCLTDMPSAEELAAILSKSRVPIKTALLNQALLAGIGNCACTPAQTPTPL